MTGKLSNDAQRSAEAEAPPRSADSQKNAENKVDFKARLAALWARQAEIKDS